MTQRTKVYRVNGVVVGYSNGDHIADDRKVCPHRGLDILHTLRCDICGSRGKEIPVYSCDLHGQCTHSIAQRGQRTREPVIAICLGCDDGPWPSS